jgi:hypothetical protein
MEKIKLTNDYELTQAEAGALNASEVRTVEIEALVDTGATMMMLPADVVAQLGVPVKGHRKVRYADSRVEEVPWVAGIRIARRARLGPASRRLTVHGPQDLASRQLPAAALITR